jgi:hypothetical protein
MNEDIANYIRCCSFCQRFKSTYTLTTITPSFVGEIWAADIAILVEQPCNRFLFVMMEYIIRLTAAVALPITDSETLAIVLLFEVVFKFGTPKKIHDV